jgi:hypothetical protein
MSIITDAINDARSSVNRALSNFKQNATPFARSQNLLRYPIFIEDDEQPFVLFHIHKATYENAGSNGESVKKHLMKSIAMYIPQNFAVADSMNYETAQTGIVGAAYERFGNDDNITLQDVQDFATTNSDALIQQYGAGAATGAGAYAGSKLGGFASTVLGGAGVGAAASGILNERQKTTQTTVNPREFALFRSPNLRNFSLNFIMIPTSLQESEQCAEIVKTFRTAMYPEVTGDGGMSYTFPYAFTLEFVNADILKLPEAVLESATVTYNPNAISFFKQNKRPVEINLTLNFKEIMPLSRRAIEAGY